MDENPARQTPTQHHPGSAPTVDSDTANGGAGHSMWWMVACCAPMVLVAVALLLGAIGTR
jgi:hypothetical protein